MNTMLRCLLVYSLLAVGSVATAAEPAGVVSTQSLGRWLDSYRKAWETRDANLAVGLFTEDATYRENPFEPEFNGRQGIHDYWAKVTHNQRDVKFDYEIISASGTTGVARWSARFKTADTGTVIELDGVFVLEFENADQCRRLREWWHLRTPG